MSSSRSSSSKSSATKSSSSSSKSSSSSSSKSARPRTAAQIRQAESLEYITALLKPHGSYLGQPILSFSTSLSLSPAELSTALAIVYFLLHLVLPAFVLPHLSALVTLIIPLKNTLVSVAKETKGKKNEDCAQWSWYWVVYGVLGILRGTLGIWHPGWKAGLEIVRSGALICVGGPWFGFEGLNPPSPSEELVKQEKVEAGEEEEAKAKADKEKLKAEKKKSDQGKADTKAKEKAGDKERDHREKEKRKRNDPKK